MKPEVVNKFVLEQQAVYQRKHIGTKNSAKFMQQVQSGTKGLIPNEHLL